METLASETASYCHASESSMHRLKLCLHYVVSKYLALSLSVCELVQPYHYLSNLVVAAQRLQTVDHMTLEMVKTLVESLLVTGAL